jgi:hypothetical protein
VVLSRADRRPTVEVRPIQFQDELPFLPVPLREPDADASFDLGAAVAAVYERGAYSRLIDYGQPPPKPPVFEDHGAWIDRLLKEKGLR